MAQARATTEIIFDGPPRAACTIALAHGAGAPLDSEFMNVFAHGLAARKFRVARFEFPYMADRRRGRSRPPDREPTLRKTWLDVIAALRGKRVIIALASGGVYADDHPYEHAKSYLKIFFNFLGIEPEFVSAGGVAMGLDEAIAGASREIELLAA